MVYEGLSGGYDLNTQMIEQAFQLEFLSKLEKCKSKEETEAIIAEYEAQRVAALASIFRIILFVVAVLFLVGIVYCVYRFGLYCFNHF
jgi:hypothetical protein